MRSLHPQKTNASTINLRPRKKICVAQVTQPTLIFTPYSKLFYPNSVVGRELQNKLNLPTLEIWRKNTYQNGHPKWKSKFLCIQSLVLEGRGLKQG